MNEEIEFSMCRFVTNRPHLWPALSKGKGGRMDLVKLGGVKGGEAVVRM